MRLPALPGGLLPSARPRLRPGGHAGQPPVATLFSEPKRKQARAQGGAAEPVATSFSLPGQRAAGAEFFRPLFWPIPQSPGKEL